MANHDATLEGDVFAAIQAVKRYRPLRADCFDVAKLIVRIVASQRHYNKYLIMYILAAVEGWSPAIVGYSALETIRQSALAALEVLPEEQPELQIDAGDVVHQTLTQIFWAGRNRTRGLVDSELVEALRELGLVQSNEGGDYIVLSESGIKRLGELPPLHLSRGGLLTHRSASDHIRKACAGPKFDLEDGRLVRVADAA